MKERRNWNPKNYDYDYDYYEEKKEGNGMSNRKNQRSLPHVC